MWGLRGHEEGGGGKGWSGLGAWVRVESGARASGGARRRVGVGGVGAGGSPALPGLRAR